MCRHGEKLHPESHKASERACQKLCFTCKETEVHAGKWKFFKQSLKLNAPSLQAAASLQVASPAKRMQCGHRPGGIHVLTTCGRMRMIGVHNCFDARTTRRTKENQRFPVDEREDTWASERRKQAEREKYVLDLEGIEVEAFMKCVRESSSRHVRPGAGTQKGDQNQRYN